jgi:hypothetical protein
MYFDCHWISMESLEGTNIFAFYSGMHDLLSVSEGERIYYYRFYFQPWVFMVLLTWTHIDVTAVCMHIQCSVTFNLYFVSCLVITPEENKNDNNKSFHPLIPIINHAFHKRHKTHFKTLQACQYKCTFLKLVQINFVFSTMNVYCIFKVPYILFYMIGWFRRRGMKCHNVEVL